MAESEEKPKSILMSVKEEGEIADLKLNIQKTKIIAFGPITSRQIDGGKVEIVTDFIFLGSKSTGDSDCSHEIKRHLVLGRKSMTNLESESESHWVMSDPLQPLDCSLPGSSVHGILQVRILEWLIYLFSKESSQPRNQTGVSGTAGRFFTSWATREAHDKPRQYIKKQRHHFADKGLYSQSYGFSSSHVQMWELDHKESWVLKNWCFQTVVLEKILESPLDCKEIKLANTNLGNQSQIFIGRTDAEAETPILWPPDVKNWLIWKDPDAGADWSQEEKRTTEDEMVGWHHRLYGHEFEQAPGVGDRQGGLACCSPWGHKESDTT